MRFQCAVGWCGSVAASLDLKAQGIPMPHRKNCKVAAAFFHRLSLVDSSCTTCNS